MKYSKNIIIVLIVLLSLQLASSCFIRTCPYYAKREHRPSHLCRSCVGGLGQCVGPHTCCGPSIGCVMTSALFDVASDCSVESEDREPCQVRGDACSVRVSSSHRATGVCAAPGICCDGDTCLSSDECPPGSHAPAPNSQSSASNTDAEEAQDEESVAPLQAAPVQPKAPVWGQLPRAEADADADIEGSHEEISNKHVVKLLKQLLKSHHKSTSHESVSSSGLGQSAPHSPVAEAPVPAPTQGKAKAVDAKGAKVAQGSATASKRP